MKDFHSGMWHELTSERIASRLRLSGNSFLANDSIAEHLSQNELDALEVEVEARALDLLRALVIDVEHDHNMRETAGRVARMFIREVFAGRYEQRPRVTDFPNAKNLDEIYTVGPIVIRSACSHHLCPVEGHAWCGVIPADRVIGLSKFSRVASWIMARPQMQEEATVQLADEIERLIAPRGLALVVRARHSCMTWRGVRETDTTMTTSVMRGLFRTEPAARSEFLAIVSGQRFTCR